MLAPIVLAALAAWTPHPGAEGASDDAVSFPEHRLTVDLSFLEERRSLPTGHANCVGAWAGTWGGAKLTVYLNVLSAAEYWMFEPEDMVEIYRDTILEAGGRTRADLRFEPTRVSAGPAGVTPLRAATRTAARGEGEPPAAREIQLVGGLLPAHGYCLRANVRPPLDPVRGEELARLLEACVAYDGALRDPQWSAADVAAYWREIVGDTVAGELAKPVRTRHYVVIGDSPAAASFAKDLEGWYETARGVLRFEEHEGRRLLPVLLFEKPGDLEAFVRDASERAADEPVYETSFAEQDYVATCVSGLDQSELRLDLTKQLMIVRARAWGGCRWFRSGLRTAAATSATEAQGAARRYRFADTIALEALIDDAVWEDGEADERLLRADLDLWEVSGLWIRFLAESPATKDRYPALVREIGALPRGDRGAVERALKRVTGLGLAELGDAFDAHYARR